MSKKNLNGKSQSSPQKPKNKITPTAKLTNYEELLIELIVLLTSSKNGEAGLSAKEVKSLLSSPLKSKGNLTALQCLKLEGRAFINELITYMNDLGC